MDYIFGRFVLLILGMTSLALLIVGVVVAAAAAGGAGVAMRQSFGVAVPAAVLAAVPGMILSLVGLVLLAVVDHFNATFDTATNTRKLLKIAESHLHVSRQALKAGQLAIPGYAEMTGEERSRLLDDAEVKRTGFLGLFRKSGPDRETPPPASSAEAPRTNGPARLANANPAGELPNAPTAVPVLGMESQVEATLQPDTDDRSHTAAPLFCQDAGRGANA